MATTRPAVSFGMMEFWVNGVERNLSTRNPMAPPPASSHSPPRILAAETQNPRTSETDETAETLARN